MIQSDRIYMFIAWSNQILNKGGNFVNNNILRKIINELFPYHQMLAAVLAALTANVRTQIVTVLMENAARSARVNKY